MSGIFDQGLALLKRVVLPVFFLGVSVNYGLSAQLDPSQFIVDGLALGGRVHFESAEYKQYRCAPSSQYADLTFCKRIKSDNKRGASVTSTTTILHAPDGSVFYVNQFIEPATLSKEDVDAEIARLSRKYGASAKTTEAPNLANIPRATMASWGPVELLPLSDADASTLREGRSPKRGILIDYLGDFTKSARVNLPIYSVKGNFGFVWTANYDVNGRGTLRFFAINPTGLAKALLTPDVAFNVTVAERIASVSDRTLTKLDQCGASCPDNPELDKLRTDSLDQLNKATDSADDAQRFFEAMSTEVDLDQYISDCDASRCGYRNDAVILRDNFRALRLRSASANQENLQYQAARGELKLLKAYVAQCISCNFGSAAIDEINQIQNKASDALFDVEVCNNEYLPVFVAFAGKPYPYSDMWTAEGWYKLSSNECKVITKLAKGDFYLTAHNFRAVWSGDENNRKKYCTSDNSFTRVLLQEGGDCLDDEKTTEFGKKHFDGAGTKFTWTINAKPWTYTALAYSPFNSSWGWAETYPSLDSAKEVALANCGKYSLDCQIASWARDDACIALASGSENNGGTALGWSTGTGARREAVSACSENAQYCRVIKSTCAGN